MLKNFLIAGVRLVALFFRALGLRSCRYWPTCSEYSAQAFHAHGVSRGIFLTLSRLARCHPFSTGGFDPLK